MDWQSIITITFAVLGGSGLLMLGFGQFVGKYKFGQTAAQIQSLQLADEQMGRLKDEVASLKTRLDERSSVELHLMEQLSTQSKQIEALTIENKELRSLIMLNQVPQPLQDFMLNLDKERMVSISELSKKIDALIGKTR